MNKKKTKPQMDFMEMTEGCMIALRYPVAHENLNISPEDEMHQLIFDIMILYKICDGVIHSIIT